MNQAREKLSHTWRHIQSFLFPMIWDELGELTAKQKLLISVLETIKLVEYLPYIGRVPGRPLEDRTAIARAFAGKKRKPGRLRTYGDRIGSVDQCAP